MEKLIIKGGKKLAGTVDISGAKNAAVAIIPACILSDGKCCLENVPDIQDTKLFVKILQLMGADVVYKDKHTIEIDCRGIDGFSPSKELTRRMRGSSYLMGALLGRFGEFVMDMPGGCDFGTRPIDQHIKCFEALGAEIDVTGSVITGKANDGHLTGANIYFDIVSVGATINAILAGVKSKGTTIIENAAKEPHIVDLANFLNAMGASIRGAGTDTIRIKGVTSLKGVTYTIIPDQIEAGTFMIAAAATRGDVTITNVIPRHLEPISAKLIEAGAKVEEYDDSIRVFVPENTKFKRVNFIAMPYPGYPTDMQPQLVTFLSTIKGTSTAREGVWDNRFRYVAELKRMGAQIHVEGKLAIIDGVDKLYGTAVCANDLRAGAAMIIAGLMAEGSTEISDIYHIDRGYENFEEKFVKLGAEIKRVTVVSNFE